MDSSGALAGRIPPDQRRWIAVALKRLIEDGCNPYAKTKRLTYCFYITKGVSLRNVLQ